MFGNTKMYLGYGLIINSSQNLPPNYSNVICYVSTIVIRTMKWSVQYTVQLFSNKYKFSSVNSSKVTVSIALCVMVPILVI